MSPESVLPRNDSREILVEAEVPDADDAVMETPKPPVALAVLRTALVLSALSTTLYGVWLLGEDASAFDGLDALANIWLYNAVIFFAGLVCFARASLSPHLRGAWIAFGLGLVSWGVGDVYWSAVLIDAKPIPYPSPADLGYLLAIPCFFVAIALLVRHRIGHFTAASWFDGAIASLAAAAVAAAVLAPAMIGLTKGDPATVITNLAYPVGDLLLIAFIAGALALGGLRDARALLLIGAGLAVWTAADVLYLWGQAEGQTLPSWTDMIWLAGALLMAASAAASAGSKPIGRSVHHSGLAVPALSTAAAVAILIGDHFARASEISIWLSGMTIVAVAARLVVSFRENRRLVRVLHDESVTDPLTGLANRRALLSDLEHVYELDPRKSGVHAFALFDLDGFKAYNDSFGHPAGDALLHRLGAGLAQAIGDEGGAYRLGGDEFCVLVPVGRLSETTIVEMSRAALSEQGEGFAITASGGSVLAPRDAASPSEALRLADQRMYAEKNQRSGRSEREAREVLLRILREREPQLGSHIDGVAHWAREVGRQLGFAGEELDVLIRAAEMHDVGKIAIPDEILDKPGPLDSIEWELMRRHTLIGERILGSTPALAPVARLVRSAHERWDGRGYPDGLARDGIPLGSRIIFVCDAFDAMTSNRPYQDAISPAQAFNELRRNAGSQFDPGVVEAFCAVAERPDRAAARA